MAAKIVFFGPPDSGRILFLQEAKQRFPQSTCLDLKGTAEEQQLDLVSLIGQGEFPNPVFLSAGPIPLSKFKEFNFKIVRVQHESWEAYVKHLKTPHRYNLQTLDEYLRAYDATQSVSDEDFCLSLPSDALFGPDKDQYMNQCWERIVGTTL